MVAIIDAMRVYAACAASFIKIPADNAMLSHVQYVRELLDSRVISALVWAGTRDMLADGTTKGVVERDLLHTCMSGRCEVHHEIKLWPAKGKLTGMERAALHLSFFAICQIHCSSPATSTLPPFTMENEDYTTSSASAPASGDEIINTGRRPRAPEGLGGD